MFHKIYCTDGFFWGQIYSWPTPTFSDWWLSHPSEKYDDSIWITSPNIWKNKVHVPNHLPVQIPSKSHRKPSFSYGFPMVFPWFSLWSGFFSLGKSPMAWVSERPIAAAPLNSMECARSSLAPSAGAGGHGEAMEKIVVSTRWIPSAFKLLDDCPIYWIIHENLYFGWLKW